MRGRMLGLMVALIVGPLCAETVQMVRVHPWLTRGAGEEAVLGFRGLVPSAGKHSVSLPVRFRLEHCTADDFTSFRLFRQPATATAAANECSIGQSFSYALPHFGEPRQTASESLRWQNGPAEATDFTLTFDNGIDATLQAGTRERRLRIPRRTVSTASIPSGIGLAPTRRRIFSLSGRRSHRALPRSRKCW